jgi:hypothetical protein
MSTEKKQHGGRREGAGRPRVYEQVAQTTLMIEAELLGRVDDKAMRLGITRTQAIQRAIARWVVQND